jgi:excisionase family DNA binding protein
MVDGCCHDCSKVTISFLQFDEIDVEFIDCHENSAMSEQPLPPSPPALVAVDRSFLTTREAAERLGISVGTVQQWVETGVLEAWKTTGGHRRVTPESVDRLLATRLGREVVASSPVATSLGSASGRGAPKAIAALPSLPPRRPLSIMVVEDDPNLLRLYDFRLRHWPMAPDVVCVGNAFSALMLLGRQHPDLLITDLHMPGMDGFAMLRVLRASPELARTQIVVVSGLDADEIERRGGLPSSVDCHPKPVPFQALQDLATRICAGSDFLRSGEPDAGSLA